MFQSRWDWNEKISSCDQKCIFQSIDCTEICEWRGPICISLNYSVLCFISPCWRFNCWVVHYCILTCCLVSYTFIFSTWLKVLPIPYFSTMCCKQTVAIVQRRFLCTEFHFRLSKILPEFSNSFSMKCVLLDVWKPQINSYWTFLNLPHLNSVFIYYLACF